MAARVEPGSFRDPDSRVVYSNGHVLRLLSARGLTDWQAYEATQTAQRLQREGKVIETELLERSDAPDDLPAAVAAVLRHERVPFVSYPYEWTFGMLKDAALLQLELLRAALEENLIVKDSSPYNVQWRGAQPVFIDVGSFERLEPGQPWVGYRQFCMLYLYPLMLQAYKGVPFQPWLRGRVGGIEPQELRNLMSLRDLRRRGVFTHAFLHAKLDRRYADTERDIEAELKRAGFKKELVAANVSRLERTIRRLQWQPPSSGWTEYGATTSYDSADAAHKAEVVDKAIRARSWKLVWDVGCNDGRFSRLAAAAADYVVALDADTAVCERLYQQLKTEQCSTILPLAMNIVDPSPALGWRGRERQTLLERGTPDLTLCLALVHHVAITNDVPIGEFLDWLRSLDSWVLIEFPTPDDPMVRRLVAAKRGRTHVDYDRPTFERLLAERFRIDETVELAAGTRVLYVARPAA
jgi:SAM-dependent methyltransferase